MMTESQARLESLEHEYAPHEDRPLGGYVRALGTFATAVTAAAAAVTARGGPDGVPTRDVVLGSIATFRASRLLAEANVTSPLRAPFTRYEGPGAPGEVKEQVREPHGGHRHALGEFVSCPYCLGTWVASAFGFGYVLAPRWTRLAVAILSMNAGSDVLQKLYSDLQDR